MNYFLHALKNYLVFSGRARRKEYWMFVLFNFIFAVAAMIVDNVLGTLVTIDTGFGEQQLPYGYIYFLYALVMFLPGLAVSVRRLHDVGKSGWFLLICLIPIVGAIWLLILFLTAGTPGLNKYGPDPKAQDFTNVQPAV